MLRGNCSNLSRSWWLKSDFTDRTRVTDAISDNLCYNLVFCLFHLWCFGGVLSTRNQASESKPADANALQDLTCCKFRVPTCCWKDSVPVEAAIDLTISVKLQNCCVCHPSNELLKQISPDAPKLSGKDTSWLSDKLTPAWLKLIFAMPDIFGLYKQYQTSKIYTTSNCLAELLKARNSLAGQ